MAHEQLAPLSNMPNKSEALSPEELNKEVRSLLSMRQAHGANPERPQKSFLLRKLAPGTPNRVAGPADIDIESNISAGNTKDVAAEHEAGNKPLNSNGSLDRISKNGSTESSSIVGKAWAADRASEAPHKSSWCSKVRQAGKSFCDVVKAHPYIIIVSFLTTAALMAAGVAGVIAAAKTETRHREESAQGFANNAAVAFEVQLLQTFSPLSALQAIIHFQPDYQLLAPRFNELAAELLSNLPISGAVASLQMTPQGVVRSFYPLPGNEAALYHNIMKDPARRNASLETMIRNKLTMQGPVKLVQGFSGAIARIPVYIANSTKGELFGAPEPAYECPPELCWLPESRSAFWGFVSCIVNLEEMAKGEDNRLVQLEELGYNYEFSAPQPDGPPMIIAKSADPPVQPATAICEVPNGYWTLLVAPKQGWVPTWRNPMLAVVVVISVLVGLLVLLTLVSRHLQLWLLKKVKASNKALGQEKQRMDVLLARQYNLISVMAQQGVVGSMGGRTGSSSLEEKTLEKIEFMRRAIGVNSFSAAGDQLQLLDLLGEGTFGKVYKGIWRGSTVAIKTMILPAKMSGAEKRERMAIMEAAISSTMNHPNIVQTYTYTVNPASSRQTSVHTHTSDGERLSLSARPAESDTHNSHGFESDDPAVHSFEVNLVLEYCDWGCLRDALESGAFFSNGVLNYAAILDTAADVAKAMLHLHCNQVIHSDLKVRNCLLKSDGSSERGCIAKVADFGLAVRMDNMDTHVSAFQGTMSHMAPEALLKGHISKAADVYSFGITLWELYTGGHAYAGIPKALLGHQVAVCGLRPSFPDFTPTDYRQLAESCWQAEPDKRPTFEEILKVLQRLRQRLGGHTAPMTKVNHKPHFLHEREEYQQNADTGPSTAAEQQAKVVEAQHAGLMQMASYYVDSSSVTSRPTEATSPTGHASPWQQQHPHQEPQGRQSSVQQQQQQGQEVDPLHQQLQRQQGRGVPAGSEGYLRRNNSRDRSTNKLPPIQDLQEQQTQEHLSDDPTAPAAAGQTGHGGVATATDDAEQER